MRGGCAISDHHFRQTKITHSALARLTTCRQQCGIWEGLACLVPVPDTRGSSGFQSNCARPTAAFNRANRMNHAHRGVFFMLCQSSRAHVDKEDAGLNQAQRTLICPILLHAWGTSEVYTRMVGINTRWFGNPQLPTINTSTRTVPTACFRDPRQHRWHHTTAERKLLHGTFQVCDLGELLSNLLLRGLQLRLLHPCASVRSLLLLRQPLIVTPLLIQ